MLFLDRDGVIIPAEAGEYVTKPEEVTLYDFAGPAISRYQRETNQPVAIVTNQAGIGLGLLPLPTHIEIQARVEVLLNGAGVDTSPDEFFMVTCPHTEEMNCGCRKPEAGMLYYAAGWFKRSPIGGFMVGDFWSDMAAGRKCLCVNILVLTGRGIMAVNTEQFKIHPDIAPDYIVRDLSVAVETILERKAYPITLDDPHLDLLKDRGPLSEAPNSAKGDSYGNF